MSSEGCPLSLGYEWTQWLHPDYLSLELPACMQIAAMLADAESPSAELTLASKRRGLEVLEHFALSTAERTTQRWWDLADALVARFSNGFQCMGQIDGATGGVEGDRVAPG